MPDKLLSIKQTMEGGTKNGISDYELYHVNVSFFMGGTYLLVRYEFERFLMRNFFCAGVDYSAPDVLLWTKRNDKTLIVGERVICSQ